MALKVRLHSLRQAYTIITVDLLALQHTVFNLHIPFV